MNQSRCIPGKSTIKTFLPEINVNRILPRDFFKYVIKKRIKLVAITFNFPNIFCCFTHNKTCNQRYQPQKYGLDVDYKRR